MTLKLCMCWYWQLTDCCPSLLSLPVQSIVSQSSVRGIYKEKRNKPRVQFVGMSTLHPYDIRTLTTNHLQPSEVDSRSSRPELLRLLAHERCLAALPYAALPEILVQVDVLPRRCCQGRGAASRCYQRIPAASSGGLLPRCWLKIEGGGNGSIARGKGALLLLPLHTATVHEINGKCNFLKIFVIASTFICFKLFWQRAFLGH